ncbi:MAG: putative metal-binding motif-containing protein [Candidatus Pacearchaeota archaeon]
MKLPLTKNASINKLLAIIIFLIIFLILPVSAKASYRQRTYTFGNPDVSVWDPFVGDYVGYCANSATATQYCKMKGYDGYLSYNSRYLGPRLDNDKLYVWNGANFVIVNGFSCSYVLSPLTCYINEVLCYDDDNDGYDTCNPGQAGDDGYIKDCNDKNALINPGVIEICNGVDDNCNGKIDEIYENCKKGQICYQGKCTDISCFKDLDCNDNNSKTLDKCINPGTIQSSCQYININCSLDSDCGKDGFIGDYPFCKNNDVYQDYIVYSCLNPGTEKSICSSSIIFRLKEDCKNNQMCENGKCIDKICIDKDGDGYDTCNPGDYGDDWKLADCDDNDYNVWRNQELYLDKDHDSYGSDSVKVCMGNKIPYGYSEINGDCNDNNSDVHPDREEKCNLIDDNCNGRVDEGCGEDSIPPSVDLIFPANNSTFFDDLKEIEFKFKVIEENEIKLCAVNVSGQIFQNTTEISKNITNVIKVNLSEGNYSAYVFCLDNYNNKGYSQIIDFKMLKQECDNIKPESIKNLHVKSKGSDFILWEWTNPSDYDFDKNIVYINGKNVINTTYNYYNASNLESNTYYTIIVHTIDKCGNINELDVKNSDKTKSEYKYKEGVVIQQTYPEPVIFPDSSYVVTAYIKNQTKKEPIIYIKSYNTKKISNLCNILFFVLVGILILLILILIVLIIKSFIEKRNKLKNKK